MYYIFDQTNSGGSFDINEDVCELVVIEADNTDEANERAENIGIYFYGCDSNMDCSCCGDRWSPASEWDAKNDLDELINSLYWSRYREKCIIHLKIGKFVVTPESTRNSFYTLCKITFEEKQGYMI